MGYTGMKGFEHRVGGLEKMDITGAVSYVPESRKNGLFEKKKLKIWLNSILNKKLKEVKMLIFCNWLGVNLWAYKTTVEELRKEGRKLHMLILIILIPCH